MFEMNLESAIQLINMNFDKFMRSPGDTMRNNMINKINQALNFINNLEQIPYNLTDEVAVNIALYADKKDKGIINLVTRMMQDDACSPKRFLFLYKYCLSAEKEGADIYTAASFLIMKRPEFVFAAVGESGRDIRISKGDNEDLVCKSIVANLAARFEEYKDDLPAHLFDDRSNVLGFMLEYADKKIAKQLVAKIKEHPEKVTIPLYAEMIKYYGRFSDEAMHDVLMYVDLLEIKRIIPALMGGGNRESLKAVLLYCVRNRELDAQQILVIFERPIDLETFKYIINEQSLSTFHYSAFLWCEKSYTMPVEMVRNTPYSLLLQFLRDDSQRPTVKGLQMLYNALIVKAFERVNNQDDLNNAVQEIYETSLLPDRKADEFIIALLTQTRPNLMRGAQAPLVMLRQVVLSLDLRRCSAEQLLNILEYGINVEYGDDFLEKITPIFKAKLQTVKDDETKEALINSCTKGVTLNIVQQTFPDFVPTKLDEEGLYYKFVRGGVGLNTRMLMVRLDFLCNIWRAHSDQFDRVAAVNGLLELPVAEEIVPHIFPCISEKYKDRPAYELVKSIQVNFESRVSPIVMAYAERHHLEPPIVQGVISTYLNKYPARTQQEVEEQLQQIR